MTCSFHVFIVQMQIYITCLEKGMSVQIYFIFLWGMGFGGCAGWRIQGFLSEIQGLLVLGLSVRGHQGIKYWWRPAEVRGIKTTLAILLGPPVLSSSVPGLNSGTCTHAKAQVPNLWTISLVTPHTYFQWDFLFIFES